MQVSIEFICMKKKKEKKTKTKKKLKLFKKLLFFSDMEYRKFLSDNYGSNKPQDTKTTSIGSTKRLQ